MATEYEVYSPTLEPFLGCVVCALKEDAEKLALAVRAKSGIGFFVREVEVGKRPIPPLSPVPTPVLVDDVRQLMSKHGQDVLVTVAWNHKTGVVNIATAGSDALYSDYAYKLGQDISVIAGCDPKEMTTHEDRRHEHQPVSEPGSAGNPA